MIKKTLYFSNPCRLSVKYAQLVVEFSEPGKEPAQVPLEDIGIVVMDHPQITVTHAVLAGLAGQNAALVSCDTKHMPAGLMLPYSGHTETQERAKAQVQSSEPLRKSLWQQVVTAKISNQAGHLKKRGLNAAKLEYLAKNIRSGDPDNCEAQAASYYWRTLMGPGWLREQEDGAYPNGLLNYAYAILRATVARSLVGSGLLPIMGIHHSNKYNAWCLADDIMEPYRPFADELVMSIVDTGVEDIMDVTVKKVLLSLPVLDTHIRNEKSPLLIATQYTSASLARCYSGETRKLVQPVLI